KKLAEEREKVKDQIELLCQMGRLLDDMRPKFSIVEGGRTQKVSAREFLMWERLKIRGKSARVQSLKVNAAQRDFAKYAAKRSIVLKARQLGITTYVAARFFLNCITRPGTLCVQVAHDQRSAEEIFRIVHRMLANLPEWLRKGALATSHANVRQIVFPHIDSSYRVETAAGPNAGRGLTIQNLHCSEVSRWPGDAAETLASLRAAVPPDGEIVLESTANGAGGCFYEEWQRAEQTGYSRHFYPWWWEPSYRRPVEIVEFNEEELELITRYGLTAEQIGFRRESRANFGRRFAEEYAEDAENCFLTSGECVFDIEVVEQRLKEPSLLTDSRDNGRLLVFFPAKPDKEYIIGVDPAGGGADGDYSVAQVIDRATGMQCAELRGHFTPEEMAARAAVLAREFNRALVAVERNNHGHAVLAVMGLNHADVHTYKVGTQAGWLTSAATRPQMLENFAAVLSAAPFLFASPRLLAECRTFIRRSDGTRAAANGAHDDTVMAMAIALAVRADVVGLAASEKAEVGVATL
ncbi:MAG TPA: terminase, partial [Candidatus Angelobacter sp.]|nr:terminase [Candidatus Angelobacter sp.]